MKLYTFDSLTAGYGEKTVIDGISGSVERGRITALIGPNGGGKSTLLRLLGGLGSYSGTLSLDGREVSSMHRRDFGRTVGFLPQNTNVRAAFTVYEVISLGRLPFHGALEPMGRQDDSVILESAELAGVDHLLFRRVTELSGGERQRVLFAMTLAQRPEVFLLDEPTSALDPSHAHRIFLLLRRLAADGRSVIAAVHDLNSAVSFCDDFIALRNGKITACASAAQLDEDVLYELYGIRFCRYRSEDGKTAWHPE